MEFQYPHIIENGGSEQLTFVRLVKEGNIECLEVENLVQPGGGPPMHVHFKQEEALTVVKGKLGIQVLGKQPEYFGPGETVTFKTGTPHKFWNAGNDLLVCKGYVKPAHNLVYFLTEIYKSTKENGGKRPDTFDAAYLSDRYKTEFEMFDIPGFVKHVIMPVSLFFGKLSGKHKKYADAPAPVI